MPCPRTCHQVEYLTEAPPSSLGIGSKKGWMTSDLLLSILEPVVRYSNYCKANIILLMDQHESHITVKAVNFCRNNGITMLSIPPHTSHKLQPLDIGVFGPFKTYCATSFNKWMTINPGKTNTMKQMAQLNKLTF